MSSTTKKTKKIIPYNSIGVLCACGNSFNIKTTTNIELLKLDICNKCHPAFLKNVKFNLDAEGKIQKFTKKFGDF